MAELIQVLIPGRVLGCAQLGREIRYEVRGVMSMINHGVIRYQTVLP